jgi:sugar-specific transcriptional regulator TrmB
VSNEKEDLLTRLGLTVNQARILLALQKIDESATVHSIARISGVTREKIYCIMPELQERGFVEKIIVSPLRYKAISFSAVVSILLKKLQKISQDMRRRAKELQAQSTQKENIAQNCDEESIVICKKSLGQKTRTHALENAKKSLDVILPCFHGEADWTLILRLYKKLSKRNTPMRFILQQPIKSKTLREKIVTLLKNPLFQIKTAQAVTTLMSFNIIDGKQVTIATSAKTFPEDYSVICTRNPVFVALTLGYFEMTWNKAITLGA